ncbi:NAD(P)/FAD-dependent oxidoreductase [Gordonia sp. TBRC 11910]|uniref:NAD(P)/FAD-dependent oxidoreductase n=2 Tax=Gordonia asplenii TaxID=2725283 RepID=A0A848L1L3_9ACTN|nr:NAD(P)/FAD-dependent oxidoreductase [Gordonia asplenii]
MVHKLREQGLAVRGIERGSDVGGTWYWNKYPGASSDSQSWVYQYSFNEEIEQEWDWSCVFPQQPEILAYLQFVADKLDLRVDFDFDTSIDSISYDDAARDWTLTTDAGDALTADYVVTAVGCLSAAQAPDIPGRDSFAGLVLHTSQWPAEPLDLADARVGIIGTGSTGIQATPKLAEMSKHLTVFQRTPQWAAPARNRLLSDAERAELKRDIRTIRDTCKSSPFGHPYWPSEQSALAASPVERTARYQADWDRGGFDFLFGSYGDLIVDEAANETMASFVREKIAELVDDPQLAARLTPDYPFGTKRLPLYAEEFYPAFNRGNVDLVSLRNEPIVEIVPEGIRTASRLIELDVLVFATGFDAMTGPLTRLNITGRDGLKLNDKWADGPQTNLGLMTRGFPNLFMVTGPGSPSVLGNMPVTIEQNVEWIGDLIETLRASGASIEPTVESEQAWGDGINEIANATLFGKYASWYSGSNIEGKPKVFIPYPGGFGEYQRIAAEIAENGYDGFEISVPSPANA